MSLITGEDDSMDAIAQRVIHEFVTTKATLAIYDPERLQRPAVPVKSFSVEIVEYTPDDQLWHVGGTIVLAGPNGDVEEYLRFSAKVSDENGGTIVLDGAKAAYIVETNSLTGACKETLAGAKVP